ncbi:hypothetical protein C8R46DRAFT_1301489 [Mycena filopes]|nr:hypothetical protein C8R46DRAFT_1301489 [Mycena filopes]
MPPKRSRQATAEPTRSSKRLRLESPDPDPVQLPAAPARRTTRAASAAVNPEPAQVKKRAPRKPALQKAAAPTPRKQKGRRRPPSPDVVEQPASSVLPLEILHAIFDLALPPEEFLNPSLHLGPNSPWSQAMRLKLALVSVCKAWNLAGTAFLYRSIALRRVHQIKPLLSTLLSTPRLGAFVHAIQFPCYVPPSHCESVAPDMAQIFALCPSLVHLEHNPAFELRPFVAGDDVPEADAAPDLEWDPADFPLPPPTLTSLKLGEGLFDIRVVQACSDSLQELSMDCVAWEADPEPEDEVYFASLHTLNVNLDADTPEAEFPPCWQMPQLKRLSITIGCDVDHANILAWLEGLLEVVGPQIEYLAFPANYTRGTREAARQLEELSVWDVSRWLQMCPNLEHVVLSEMYILENDDADMRFPTIKYLDMWRSNVELWDRSMSTRASAIRNILDVETALRLGKLPNLQHVRLLDTALAPLVDVPRVFDRDVHAAWDLRTVPGMRVQQFDLDQHASPVFDGRAGPWIPCPASVIRSSDVQAAWDWAETDFGAREIALVKADLATVPAHIPPLRKAPAGNMWLMQQLARIEKDAATPSDDEEEDPSVFNNMDRAKFDAVMEDDSGSDDDSCGSLESEDVDMLDRYD